MDNIQPYGSLNQAITNEDIRTLILQNGNLDRKKIAEKADRATATIWNWVNDRTNFPAYGVSIYTQVTGDTSIIDAICQACGFVAVPVIDFNEIDKALTKLEIEINLAQARYVEEIEKSRSPESAHGHIIDRLENKRIQAKGLDAIRIIRASMLAIKGIAK